MNNSRGFTLIEMIIGGAVLLIVLMIATSFFIFQSRHGGQLMRETGVRETVSSALTMIKRDIMQAGSGLSEQPELGLCAEDYIGSGTRMWYTKLFVSYGAYLSTGAAPETPNLDYVTNTNVYSVYGKAAKKTGAVFTGEKAAVTAFTIAAMPNDIWGVLTYNKSVTPKVAFSMYTASAENTPSTDTYLPKYRFTIPSTTVEFTPGICYELSHTTSATPAVADVNFPELRRNGLTIAGGIKDRSIKFIKPDQSIGEAGGFRIRCQFIDTGNNETWVPSSSATFDTQDFTNLRMVEVQLRYRMKKSRTAEGEPTASDKEAGWSQIVTKTINVSPRELVLARY